MSNRTIKNRKNRNGNEINNAIIRKKSNNDLNQDDENAIENYI